MLDPVRPIAVQPLTRFGAAAARLEERAEARGHDAAALWCEAGDQLESAGARGGRAAAHLAGAVVGLGAAGAHLGHGLVVDGGATLAHGAAAASLGLTGAAVRGAEEGLGLVGRACQAIGRAFVGLANLLHRMIGDGRTVTVREIEQVGRERLSTQMWREAGWELSVAGDAYGAALASFEQAVTCALGAGVNLAAVAGYSAMALGDVAQALTAAGGAAACAAARQLNRLAALGVQAAEKGLAGAAELLAFSARAAARLGNLLVKPKNGAELEVGVRAASREVERELDERLRHQPALARLPAARAVHLAPLAAG